MRGNKWVGEKLDGWMLMPRGEWEGGKTCFCFVCALVYWPTQLHSQRALSWCALVVRPQVNHMIDLQERHRQSQGGYIPGECICINDYGRPSLELFMLLVGLFTKIYVAGRFVYKICSQTVPQHKLWVSFEWFELPDAFFNQVSPRLHQPLLLPTKWTNAVTCYVPTLDRAAQLWRAGVKRGKGKGGWMERLHRSTPWQSHVSESNAGTWQPCHLACCDLRTDEGFCAFRFNCCCCCCSCRQSCD